MRMLQNKEPTTIINAKIKLWIELGFLLTSIKKTSRCTLLPQSNRKLVVLAFVTFKYLTHLVRSKSSIHANIKTKKSDDRENYVYFGSRSNVKIVCRPLADSDGRFEFFRMSSMRFIGADGFAGADGGSG
ncbi:hypothetical protein L1887_17935 [Cichorium endivia]|nr:hypothetical protein L1887_17935 [Cichorium endivia]